MALYFLKPATRKLEPLRPQRTSTLVFRTPEPIHSNRPHRLLRDLPSSPKASLSYQRFWWSSSGGAKKAKKSCAWTKTTQETGRYMSAIIRKNDPYHFQNRSLSFSELIPIVFQNDPYRFSKSHLSISKMIPIVFAFVGRGFAWTPDRAGCLTCCPWRGCASCRASGSLKRPSHRPWTTPRHGRRPFLQVSISAPRSIRGQSRSRDSSTYSPEAPLRAYANT